MAASARGTEGAADVRTHSYIANGPAKADGLALGGTLLVYLQMKYGIDLERDIIEGFKILPQTGGSPPS